MHEIAVFICVCIHTCILIRTVRRFYIVVVKLLLCESHPFFPFKKWIRSTFLEVSNEHAREHTHTRTHTSSTRPEIFQSGDSLFLACACARFLLPRLFLHLTPQRFFHLLHRRSSILPEKALLPSGVHHA